ncbi:hypothetical protein LL252_04410 [Alcanivorax marinus]|uniref:GTPase n=1 Tax=Alloalcanivorax marinus TaxID=1177169 RepID=A0A9Q3UL47_9GAMM|nr:hypothetical protein [Alloalcanivorax marinus]MCC4307808.1 hypothetical protein [Alloalcanivorax marinus]
MHEAWPTDWAWALPDTDAPLESLSLASTRPPELRAWLTALPADDPLTSAARLTRLLDELTRLPLDTRHRLALLEDIRPRVHCLTPSLQSPYLGAPLSLTAPSRQAADPVADLFDGLARAYQRVAAALLATTPEPARRQAAATALQRALDALSQQLWQHWLLYTPARAGLWWRLHRLYAVADALALQTLAVADPEASGQQSSVHLAYTRALLVASAQPQQLRPPALLALFRAAGQWGRWLPLRARPLEGGFDVALDQDRGPVPAGDPVRDGPRWRHFDTRPLARALIDGGGDPGRPFSSLLRAHLRAVWSVPRGRAAPRRAGRETVRVVLGLNGAHACLDQPARAHNAEPVYCQDRGQQGCGLLWHGPAPRGLRVGAVLAVADTDGGPWRVGEIRWLARAAEGVRAGVQWLPGEVRPVRISHGYGDTLPTPALLVPAADGADTLLVPTAGFAAGARVTVWEGPPRLVRLGARVAGSADACRYRLRRE